MAVTGENTLPDNISHQTDFSLEQYNDLNTEPAQIVADLNNRFASDLYLNLSHSPDYTGKNIFFSPLSISSAGALTYEGARGKTADEIRAVFHFPENSSILRKGYAGVNPGSPGPTVYSANALWAEKTHQFLPEYIALSRDYYSANVTNLDFVNKSGESRDVINGWVAEKTNNKIRDLVSPASVNSATDLVITNAMYFNDSWLSGFDKGQEQEFRVEPGKTVPIQMMEKTGSDQKFMYTDTGELQALDIPYQSGNGTRLSMLVLLPKEDNITPAEKVLRTGNLSSVTGALRPTDVIIYFPKFRLETEYQLPDLLKKMGMNTAFTPDADFSGMDGAQDLFINDFIHKAFVDVNEQGTEASAATVVSMNEMAIPDRNKESPVVFKADHPFIFMIRDDKSGAILFMGRVMNPAGAPLENLTSDA
ncbi:serpin family protein [Methanospirillum lacunae]|nr:serpin family protein [Methanospirillum lacunae]